MKKITLEKMPTAVTADNHPIHNWFNFVAGYSPEYVKSVIDSYEEQHKIVPKMIYDPFAGSGTTNVVANMMGIQSIGVERNPFFYKIGKAKTDSKLVLETLEEVYSDFLEIAFRGEGIQYENLFSEDAITFLEKLFEVDDLRQLVEMRQKVLQSNSEAYIQTGYIFLSKILEYATFAKTDGIYKVPTSKKNNLSVIDSIEKSKKNFEMGEESISEVENKAEYIFNSSVDFQPNENSLDLVIFSPPYLNNFDFAEMTRMQMYFWDEASSWADISSKHRNHMIVNTTTALKNVRKESVQLQMREGIPQTVQVLVEPIVEELKAIKKENSRKKDYYLIVYPYLFQMKEVINRCYIGLKEGGEIHIVVSDAAFYGIHVDTHLYLEEIMKDIGFKDTSIIRMRDRGDRWILDKRKSSGKQLGEFEIVGVK